MKLFRRRDFVGNDTGDHAEAAALIKRIDAEAENGRFALGFGKNQGNGKRKIKLAFFFENDPLPP